MSNLNTHSKPAPPEDATHLVHPARLRIFIADDEMPARVRLRTLLDDIAGEIPTAVIGEAVNGHETLQLLKMNPADVALLDISMPGMNGIDLARQLAALEFPPIIIFVTAFDSFALEAFDVNAIDYLMKPVRATRLSAALGKACLILEKTRAMADAHGKENIKFVYCHERGRILRVPVSDILYFKADLKYVLARTAEREYLLDDPLTHLEKQFADQFIRLHRSILVAHKAISGFERAGQRENGWVALINGIKDPLPVSRRQWSIVRQLVESNKHNLIC